MPIEQPDTNSARPKPLQYKLGSTRMRQFNWFWSFRDHELSVVRSRDQPPIWGQEVDGDTRLVYLGRTWAILSRIPTKEELFWSGPEAERCLARRLVAEIPSGSIVSVDVAYAVLWMVADIDEFVGCHFRKFAPDVVWTVRHQLEQAERAKARYVRVEMQGDGLVRIVARQTGAQN